MFQTTVTYVEEGRFDLAMAELDRQYALGKGIGDAAAMAGDATFMGNVLLESGKPAEALKKFEQAVQVTEASQLAPEVKEPVPDPSRPRGGRHDRPAGKRV
jgi:predicted negative regulator of RcsB-dependent stress response